MLFIKISPSLQSRERAERKKIALQGYFSEGARLQGG
jgi:hypothetical protein